MNKLFLLLIIFFGNCSVTQPVIVSSTKDTIYINRIVTDTFSIVKHDTINSIIKDTTVLKLFILSDTTNHIITLSPSIGDSYEMIQNAINFCIQNPGYKIHLTNGNFYISKPLIAANIINGIYHQVTINIEGFTNAKNTPSQNTTNIIPTFNNTFAIGIQQGKGCIIKNILFQGKFTFPNALMPIQIDTLNFINWTDGQASNNITSPYSAIVIDPFSDSTLYDNIIHLMYEGLHSYYLPKMSPSGSTAINIEGCGISNFVVGIMVTPSYQQNGELINVNDCRIDYCRSSYAFTQAQSKANTINDLECWGGTHTVLDGYNYGAHKGDGATCPIVNVINIAGAVHQLINAYSNTFPISIDNVYAEGLFKIGSSGGGAGTHFNNFQIDFQVEANNVPSPDYYYYGFNTYWTNCMLRVYGTNDRIVLNGSRNYFYGGAMSTPPICRNLWLPLDNISYYPPIFSNVFMYYSNFMLNSNNYDSIISLSQKTMIVVDRSTFNGYFIDSNIGEINIGDLLLTSNNYTDQLTGIFSYEYPLGYVSNIGHDTIYLKNIGVGIENGQYFPVSVAKTKNIF
jgi:hypothetical protein